MNSQDKVTTKHTSGPWAVDPAFICDIKAEGCKIATAWSEDEAGQRLFIAYDMPLPTAEEQEANAHLIASAPELLAVVHRFLYDADCIDGNNYQGFVDQARAAYDKATGVEAAQND